VGHRQKTHAHHSARGGPAEGLCLAGGLADEQIARPIVRRIISMRVMQAAGWEDDAIAEIRQHLNAARRKNLVK
jgi:hypothetical protein